MQHTDLEIQLHPVPEVCASYCNFGLHSFQSIQTAKTLSRETIRNNLDVGHPTVEMTFSIRSDSCETFITVTDKLVFEPIALFTF